MKRIFVVGLFGLLILGGLTAFAAGLASRSVNVDGRIDSVFCSNGVVSVVTEISRTSRKVYNFDLSGNLMSTLSVTGSN